MSTPLLVNKKPAEGATDVGGEDPVRVGLRDADTHVDLSTIYAALLYARAVYRPAVLPEDDPILNSDDENIEQDFTIFNDAAGGTLPGNPADRTIQVVGPDTVHRIERTGGAQEGFLYVSDSVEGDRPFEAEARFTIDTVVPGGGYGTYAYTVYTDFTGVLFGFVYWPRNTGVFLFFRDDGVNKYVTVAGPATDGIGTRTSFADVIFDWSLDSFTYKIVWDETGGRSLVMVFGISSDGLTETLLHEEPVSSFYAFLGSVKIGPDSAEDPPQRIAVIVGDDGPTAGDSIDVYKLALYRFGGPALYFGQSAGNSPSTIFSKESIRLDGDSADWLSSGTGAAVDADGATNISRVTGDGTGAFPVYRDETDLARQEWIVLAKLRGQDADHGGTYDTAMGVTVEDGTSAFHLRFFDDFTDHDVGVLNNAVGDVAANYDFGATQVEWESEFAVVMVGSAARNSLRTFFTDDETPAITGTYNPVDYPASTNTRISTGFIRSGNFFGTLEVEHLWLLPNCFLYEPSELTFPEAQGWTRTFSGGARSTVGGKLMVDCTVPGEHDVYSLTSTDYTEASGVAHYFKVFVTEWTDTLGAVNPVRRIIGPVAMVAVGASAVKVQFVQLDDGTTYVYLPREDEAASLTAVINQSAVGRRISAEIDLTDSHVFILIVTPFDAIRLFRNYSTEAVIEVPWDNGFDLPVFPSFVPAGSHVAFGSLGQDSGVEATFTYARTSLGTGFDISVRLELSEEELQGQVYGSEADLLVDFEDED